MQFNARHVGIPHLYGNFLLSHSYVWVVSFPDPLLPVYACTRYSVKYPVLTQATILQRTFTKPIVELKTWQMLSERCASLGSVLYLICRLCRLVFLNFASSLVSTRVSAEGLHFSAFHCDCSGWHAASTTTSPCNLSQIITVYNVSVNIVDLVYIMTSVNIVDLVL